MADTLPGRRHYLFDSFEGLPAARAEVDGEAAIAFQRERNHPHYHDNCSAEMNFAERAMRMSAAREYHVIKGWFKDTIPSFMPAEPIAILRLDGDFYDSTLQALTGLYPHVTHAGLIIIDDYFDWEGCTRAVHQFLAQIQSIDRIRTLDGVCYWKKETKTVERAVTTEAMTPALGRSSGVGSEQPGRPPEAGTVISLVPDTGSRSRPVSPCM